jgi:hydrogenase nickel incorporation protein HypA/HybF
MHEMSLIHDLMRKIETIARDQNAVKVVGVKIRLGALAHISADHFREHFEEESKGTIADGARLHVELLTDENDPQAQDIMLDSVEVED